MRDEKIKLASDVPEPKELTDEALKEIAKESREWRADLSSRTAKMESLSPEDLKIRAR